MNVVSFLLIFNHLTLNSVIMGSSPVVDNTWVHTERCPHEVAERVFGLLE